MIIGVRFPTPSSHRLFPIPVIPSFTHIPAAATAAAAAAAASAAAGHTR